MIQEEIETISGYSVDELAQIEFTFETNTKHSFKKYVSLTQQEILEDQFNGLKAVIELMMQFDNIEGEQYVEKFRERLVEAE